MTSIPLAGELNLVDEPSVLHTLRVTLATIGACALAISAFTLLLRWPLTPELALVASASSVVALVLSRSGRIRLAIMLPLLTITYAVLHSAARSDGIQSIGLTILPVLIMVGSLVLDRPALVFFTASIVLGVAGMLAIRYFVLLAERYSTNDMGDLFIFTITCTAAALVGRLIALRVKEGFRRAEVYCQDLRAAERNIRLVAGSLSEMVLAYDADKNLIYANPGAEKMTGYGFAELQAAAPLSWTHPEDRPQVLALWHKVFDGQMVDQVVYRLITKDGTAKWVAGSWGPVTDEAGRQIGIRGTCQDITERVVAERLLEETTQRFRTVVEEIAERKRVEEELRRSEERFRLAIAATNDAIWDVDLKTGTVTWNETYSTLYGRPPETSDSWQWWIDRIQPEDRERTVDGLRRAISSGGSSWTCEYRFQRADGNWAYIYDRAYIARDGAGLAWRVIGAMQDLTERKSAEEERVRLATLVEKEHERLNAIISSIPGAVWETWGSRDNPAKQVKFMSNQAEEMLGYTVEEWMTAPSLWPLIVHPDDRSRFVREATEIFTSNNGSGSHQYRCLTRDGRTVWLESHVSVIREQTGKPIGLCGVTIDISERREALVALMRAREELARVSRAITMGEVAASIAHEINQPLAAVVINGEACLEYLATTAPNIEKVKVILTSIIGDGNRASEVIKRIRALFAGSGTREENFDLNELVQDTTLLLQEYAQSHNVLIRTSLEEPLPAVFGDRTQLRQVLINLIRNGIEATDNTLHEARLVIIRTKSEGSPGVRVEVSDCGVGIQPGDRERIFQPFFTTKEGGLGMGLAISRTIVESHGGRILVEPNQPHGTRLLVFLPNERMT